MPVWWFLPGFPNCAELHNHLGWCCGVFCQSHQACKQCPAFGLLSTGRPGDGAEALQLPHRLCVQAKAENPDLASGVVVVGSGIKCEGKAGILVWADGLQLFPNSMSLIRVVLLQMLLWFKWYPAFGPQGFFFWVGDALKPFWWEWLVLLSSAPFAQPEHMLCRSRNVTEGTLFGSLCITEMDCSLNPCLQVPRLLFWELGFEAAVGVPVEPCEQVLMVWSPGKSVGALLLCLSVQEVPDLPPLVRDVHFSS